MSTGYVALAAAMIVGGIFMTIRGLRPGAVNESGSGGWRNRTRTRWRGVPTRLRWRLAGGLAAGIVVLAFTGFIPALVLVPALVVILPELLRAQPQPEIEIMEALDRWIRVLTASVRTGKSVNQALRSTQHQAPALLADPLAGLIRRLDDRWALRDGLQQMADDLDSADADAVLAALVLVGERGGVGATGTLQALSDSLQDRLRAAREIATERAKPQFVVRQVSVITLAAVGLGMVFAPDYFRPFSTPLGQVLLLVLGGCYLGSLYVLRKIAIPPRRERILVRRAGQEVMADA
ncbi:type II secretion system F family protein [Propionimicrobium sp. PCR01-08-3]|uniref:type II secretion system F family protein n=1 Tax=Propionimicrobium sp. PCR01-08-3 TaxID=3052086 RepID=UPI00255CE9B7|nr:type II secretion system F family protein [Propionimicrobium sp. PCR01-08-3]WIY82558.1 type II secretion system F family protein [Propionimicrobium sp. PCR01-08-3]